MSKRQWSIKMDLYTTVVPALSGHLLCADTLSISRHISRLNYLWSASTCLTLSRSHLLVVSTCYNGQCKQMPRFRWSFQPKIAGAHPNLRPTDLSNVRAVVWWLWQCVYPLGISLVVIVLCSIARCIIFGPPACPSLWRAATCNVRTLLPGPEGVRSWQLLLYLYFTSMGSY